ncbi:MAG: hypothetical protein RDU30_00920 [Desulfovibrionaceae bacterium]|nr:hypothetical protein [Desulfovibrionaceae bacterium]
MNALLTEIREAGLAVAVDGDGLVIKGLDALPEEAVDRWLVRLLGRKAAIMEALAAESAPAVIKVIAPEQADHESDVHGPDAGREACPDEFRPCRENCAHHGCAAWLGNGSQDRAVCWRCLGAIHHNGESVETADMPKLAALLRCPWLQLEGGGQAGLGWWPESPDDDTDMGPYEACGTLKDLCERYALRVVPVGDTFRVRYPVGAAPNLVAYSDLLLEEAMPYIVKMVGVRHG